MGATQPVTIAASGTLDLLQLPTAARTPLQDWSGVTELIVRY